jgi:hypothetical protein
MTLMNFGDRWRLTIAVVIAWLAAGCGGCPAGTTPCEGRCIDVESDSQNCGACGALCYVGTCQSGVCGCPEGTRECDGECVGLDDVRHCGACGNACLPGAVCVDGACACPDGTQTCPDRCARLAEDPESCGACGAACAPGQSCEGGVCQCPDPTQEGCATGCADLSADHDHCGACDVRCPAEAVCRAGACECPGGLAACGDACVSLATDPSHCGACDAACPSPRACVGGDCRCPGADTFCAGACVDLDADVTNCGACGSRCSGGASCIAGRCAPSYRWHDTAASGGSMISSPEWDGRVAVSPDGAVVLAYSSPFGSVWLVRYAPDGALSWSRELVTYAVRVGDVAAAADGSVVLTASFESSWRSPGRATHVGVSGSDVAIVSFDAAGLVQWERFVETDGADYAGGVAIAPGRVVVSGSVGGAFDYGGGSIDADFFRDAFVLELDEASGTYVDAHVYGDRGSEEPVFVTIAPDGDVVLAGYSGAGVDFGGGPTSTVRGGFVARLSPTYAHRWSRAVRADTLHGVAVDASGDVYVSGGIDRSVDFGDGVSLDAGGTFVLAMDGATGSSRWAARVAGGYVDLGRGPVAAATGTLWVGGTNTAGSMGSFDAVLAAYDADGNERYRRMYGSTASDVATGIATAGETLAFAGRFHDSASFGGRTETSTDFDVFLLVFDL